MKKILAVLATVLVMGSVNAYWYERAGNGRPFDFCCKSKCEKPCREKKSCAKKCDKPCKPKKSCCK